MSPAEVAFRARLERRALQMRPDLARRYLEAYDLIREALNTNELRRALSDGSVDRLLESLVSSDPTTDPKLASLRARLDQMVLDATRLEAKHLPGWIRPVEFNLVSPVVIDAARAFDGAALRTLSDEVTELIRTAVVKGLEQGKNPRAIARNIRESVGLTSRQWEYVANFRRELETGSRSALQRVLGKGVIDTEEAGRIVRRAHAAGEGLTKAQMRLLERTLGKGELTKEQIDGMVDAYRRRLIALNTEAHVKTQTLQAQKIASRVAWEDAIDRGVVNRSDLKRKWLTVLDGRERPEHHDLNGTVVGFDEPFPNGEITPGESTYNCRCAARVFVSRGADAAAQPAQPTPPSPEDIIKRFNEATKGLDGEIEKAGVAARKANSDYMELVYAGVPPDDPRRLALVSRMADADAQVAKLQLQKNEAIAKAIGGGRGGASAPMFADDEIGNGLGRDAWSVTNSLFPEKYLHNSSSWSVSRAMGQRAYAHDGRVLLSNSSDIPVGVHEFAHLVEQNNPAILRAAREFRDRRTEGEALRPLAEIFNNPRYGPEELAKPDEFFSPYIGKDYGDEATEVVSMGIERMLRDPSGFYDADKEHFELILQILLGGF